MEPFDPTSISEQLVNSASFRDDENWLRKNPARKFRIRDIHPDDWPQVPDKSLLGRPLKVLVFRIPGGQATTLIPAPLLSEMNDPWVVSSGGSVMRFSDAERLVRQHFKDNPIERKPGTSVSFGLSEVLDNSGVQRSKEYRALRSKEPLRCLTEVAEESLVAIDILRRFFPFETLSTALTHAYRVYIQTRYHKLFGDEKKDIVCFFAEDLADFTHAVQVWKKCGMPIYRLTRELIRHLTTDPIEIDDDVPVAIPHDAFFVDVTDLPLAFPVSPLGDTTYLYFRRAKQPDADFTPELCERWENTCEIVSEKIVEIVNTDTPLDGDEAVLESSTDSIRLLDEGAENVWTFGFFDTAGNPICLGDYIEVYPTWSQWFKAIAKISDPWDRDAARLLVSFLYLLRVRHRAGVVEREVVDKRPSSRPYKYRPVDAAIVLPKTLTPRKNLGGVGTAPDRKHLIEGRTVRAEHTRTQRYGVGLSQSKVITIPERPDTKTWVRKERSSEGPRVVRVRKAKEEKDRT